MKSCQFGRHLTALWHVTQSYERFILDAQHSNYVEALRWEMRHSLTNFHNCLEKYGSYLEETSNNIHKFSENDQNCICFTFESHKRPLHMFNVLNSLARSFIVNKSRTREPVCHSCPLTLSLPSYRSHSPSAPSLFSHSPCISCSPCFRLACANLLPNTHRVHEYVLQLLCFSSVSAADGSAHTLCIPKKNETMCRVCVCVTTYGIQWIYTQCVRVREFCEMPFLQHLLHSNFTHVLNCEQSGDWGGAHCDSERS